MKFTDSKPIYLQIADLLTERILSARYTEGMRLPSVRDIATELEVNVNTVTRSFEWLQQHDIVEVRRGMGNYILSGAHEAILTLRRQTFFTESLPTLLREMDTLGITLRDVEQAYTHLKLSENP